MRGKKTIYLILFYVSHIADRKYMLEVNSLTLRYIASGVREH